MDDAFTPGLIIGLMLGFAITLLVQAYGRRKVRKALAAMGSKNEVQTVRGEREAYRGETVELARRLAVLEQIVTDRPRALADQIELLR